MQTQRSITILYGSQTGTAQEVAERLVRDAKRRHFATRCAALDNYDRAQLPLQKFVLFVVATTGQGDAPDNMKQFWRFLLRKSLPMNSLQGVQVAVLGLGDSSYPKFNFVGKMLQRRLVQLGAIEIVPRGDANDQHELGLDGEFVPWSDKLWQQMDKLSPMPPHMPIIPASKLPAARYKIVMSSQQATTVQMQTSTTSKFDEKHPFMAKMIENTRITAATHFQDVRHIAFDISGSNISYEPGDVLAMYCHNKPDYVKQLLLRFGLVGEQFVSIQKVDPDAPSFDHVPQPLPLVDLFTKYLHIEGTPRRFFFELLSHFASNEDERERLQYFGSAEGSGDMISYNTREKRTVLEVLTDFPSALPPLDYLLDLIPQMPARYFSISSSQLMHPSQIHITVAIVQFKTPYKRARHGMCTSWLASLNPSTQTIHVPIWIKDGQIKLPSSDVPLIMVGPGTGMAPFRSFIQSRVIQAQSCTVAPSILFFGNRNHDADFLYGTELQQYAQNEKNSFTLDTAFSRDQDNKIYVQHKITAQGAKIWQMLSQDATFYIAGNAKQMPTDVKDAVKLVLKAYGGMNEQQAEEWIRKREMVQKYQVETWS